MDDGSHSLRFRSVTRELSVEALKALRGYCPLGLQEIRRRAEQGVPLLEFGIFDNAWQESKAVLRQLLKAMESGVLPLVAFEQREGEEEGPFDAAGLRGRLGFLRAIEIEQGRATQLALGEIQSPEEYAPEDEAW